MSSVFEYRTTRLANLYKTMNLPQFIKIIWDEIVDGFNANKIVMDHRVDMFDFVVIGADNVSLKLGDEETGQVYLVYYLCDITVEDLLNFGIYERDE